MMGSFFPSKSVQLCHVIKLLSCLAMKFKLLLTKLYDLSYEWGTQRIYAWNLGAFYEKWLMGEVYILLLKQVSSFFLTMWNFRHNFSFELQGRFGWCAWTLSSAENKFLHYFFKNLLHFCWNFWSITRLSWGWASKMSIIDEK